MGKLPNKIKKCPLVEALIEVRFEPSIIEDAVFGVIHNELKAKYPIVDGLPILQVPREVVHRDKNLQYKAHFSLKPDKPELDTKFNVQIGPRVVTLVNVNTYVGWDSFLQEASEILPNVLVKTNIAKKVSRLGLRYINFLVNEDVFQKSNLSLDLGGRPINSEQQTIKLQIEHSGFLVNLTLANKGELNSNGSEIKKGSLFDIDVFIDKKELASEEIIEYMKSAHKVVKELFFSYLNADYIDSMEPEY